MRDLEIAIQAVRHYAETHPRPSQVTQTQAAEMLGISSKTVSRMIKAGQINLNGCGLIPISEIDRALHINSKLLSPSKAATQKTYQY